MKSRDVWWFRLMINQLQSRSHSQQITCISHTHTKVLLEQTESNNARLTSELSGAEALIAVKTQALQTAELQLNSTREDLSKANVALADREGKVRVCVCACLILK